MHFLKYEKEILSAINDLILLEIFFLSKSTSFGRKGTVGGSFSKS